MTEALQQLQSVRLSLEDEIQTLSGSFSQLRSAHGRFSASLESLNDIKGSEILVPLTSSLYVPGKLVEEKTVIVDIGTGYYVSKSIPDAKSFYKRKVDFLRENIEKLQQTLNQKQQQFRMVTDMMEKEMEQVKKK